MSTGLGAVNAGALRGVTFHVEHAERPTKPCSSGCGRTRDVFWDARCKRCRSAYKKSRPRRKRATCVGCDRAPRPGQDTCRICHRARMKAYRARKAEEQALLLAELEALRRIVDHQQRGAKS